MIAVREGKHQPWQGLHTRGAARREQNYVPVILPRIVVKPAPRRAKAEEVLAERPSIRLSPEAAAAFSQALEQPARVNERLARALRRRRKFEWLD
jgi:hypothetical protein